MDYPLIYISAFICTYLISNFINISGQSVSLIINIICLIIITPYISSLLKIRVYFISILLILVIPLVSYVINYHGQDYSGLLFWLKRAVSGVITIGAGIILFTRVQKLTLVYFAETIFIIISSCILLSWSYPIEALYFFTGADEVRWGDLSTINTIAPSGTFIDVNNTGVALVGSYLVCHTMYILAKGQVNDTLLHIVFFDALLSICILIGGSRSTMIIGSLCLAIIYIVRIKKIFDKKNITVKKKVILNILFLAFGIILLANIFPNIFANIFGSYGAERIYGYINGNESNSAFESSELRVEAAKYALNLFSNNLFGISFDAVELQGVILPHNMFIYYAVTNGLVALIFYIYAIYAIICSVNKRRLQWLSGCYLVVIIGFSLFLHTFIEHKTFPLLIMGVIYLFLDDSSSFPHKMSIFRDALKCNPIPKIH